MPAESEPPSPAAALGNSEVPRGSEKISDGSEESEVGMGRRLLETEGGQSLPTIQDEYGCSKPVALIARGTMKMARATGFPAIADLGVGIALLLLRFFGDRTPSSDGEESDQQGGDQGGDVDVVGG